MFASPSLANMAIFALGEIDTLQQLLIVFFTMSTINIIFQLGRMQGEVLAARVFTHIRWHLCIKCI
jgi:hypothetical protein